MNIDGLIGKIRLIDSGLKREAMFGLKPYCLCIIRQGRHPEFIEGNALPNEYNSTGFSPNIKTR
jgi:hypothetical protein